MDGPDIQKLYGVCCDSYHTLRIVDWFPPIIARGGSKGLPMTGFLLVTVHSCFSAYASFSRTLIYAIASVLFRNPGGDTHRKHLPAPLYPNLAR